MIDTTRRADLGPVRFGRLFGLLAVLFGWSLGLVFGAVAKESLRGLATPSAGALYVGALITLVLVVADLFFRRRAKDDAATP